MRLDVNSILKDKNGGIISYKYSGIIQVTPGVAAVLGGKEGAKSTDFGDACKFKFIFSIKFCLRMFLSRRDNEVDYEI